MGLLRFAFACLLCLTLLLPAAGAQAAAPVLLLDATDLDASQRQLAASLQGVANRAAGGPRVFLLTCPTDESWLAYSLRMDPRPAQSVTLEELLAQVKPRLQGQVLYDPARPYTLDVGTLAAGIRGAALSDKDLGLTTVYDFRTQWNSAEEAYRWAVSTLLPQASRGQIALLSSDSSAMRDYAIAQKMLTLSSAAGLSKEAWQDLLFHVKAGTAVYGEYAPDLLSMLSEGGHYVVPAGSSANLSFYATRAPEARSYQYPGHLEPVAPRYLTLIFDCSDLDTALNRMPELWESPVRGSLPLGWAIPAALQTVAPVAVHKYYADAYHSGSDQFVLGMSGAGFMEVARAEAPGPFYQATAKAVEALDARTVLYQAPGAPEGFGDAVTQMAQEGGVSGVFLLTRADQPPAIYHGVPALVTSYVDSVEQAITYLNRIPVDRRFAALCLNAATMTPEEAAHIAAHVTSRYLVVPPAELMSLMLSVGRGEQTGTAGITVTSAEFPEGTIAPDAPVPVHVEIEPQDKVFSAEVVYRAAGSRVAFSEPLRFAGNKYQAELPPLRWGGDVEAKVRAVDTEGRVTWSPLWTMKVARTDTDGDGSSDAEEAYLLTDPTRADTDGDGLLDGTDPRPLVFDQAPVEYFGPVAPPSDVPYITNPEESAVDGAARVVAPGTSASYWLPTYRVPPGGAAVVSLEASGQAEIALGADPGAVTPRATTEVKGAWESEALPVETYPTAVYVRLTCPAGATAPLRVYSLALASSQQAPSLMQVQHVPSSPGPEQPVAVWARAFGPEGVARVELSYRVNGKGLVSVPMTEVTQRYVATVPSLANRDELEYWVTAQDKTGRRSASAPQLVTVGGRGRELIPLRARQSFVGAWRPSPEWGGEASVAREPGASDTAPANLTGGSYTVWVLAAGRGSGLSVSIDGERVGAIEPNKPDGWQRVGRAKLEAGKHRVTVTAEAASPEAAWTSPRYAEVLLATDGSFEPPVDQVYDMLNSLVLLSPAKEATLTGVVELKATGAGNLTAVEFSLDGTVIKRVVGPPFTLSVNTSRYANGPHTLRIEAVDRTGPTGMVLEAPVTVAN